MKPAISIPHLCVGIDAREICDRPAGKGQYLVRLIQGWIATLPFDMVIYIAAEQEAPTYVLDAIKDGGGVRLEKVSGPGVLWHWKVARQLKGDGVDVFFASQSYFSAIFNPVPTVTVVHDLAVFQKGNYSNNRKAQMVEPLTLARSVRSSAKIIAVSESTKRDLVAQTKVEKDKVEVIYEAAMLASEVQAPLPFSSREPYFLFVGTLEPRKNIRTLLEAYAALPEKLRARYQLKLVGKVGWGGEDYSALAEELGLAKHILFMGYVSNEDLLALYKNALLFIYPSWYEGFGLPVIEAMAVGTPVITSTTSSLPEVVGETAFTCDPSNVQEMTRTIIEALHDSDDWTRRSEAQFARAHLFNWEAIGEQTAKVIQEAINA